MHIIPESLVVKKKEKKASVWREEASETLVQYKEGTLPGLYELEVNTPVKGKLELYGELKMQLFSRY